MQLGTYNVDHNAVKEITCSVSVFDLLSRREGKFSLIYQEF